MLLNDVTAYEVDPLAVDAWAADDSDWDPAWEDDWGSKPEAWEEEEDTWVDALGPMTDFQLRVLAAVLEQHPSIAVRGGWGCAKTATQAIVLWYIATTRPGARCMWVTDNSNRRDGVVLVEAMKFWLGARYESSKRRWVFPNGSVIWLREYFRHGTKSSYQNPLEGPTMHAICVDEAQVFNTKEVADKAAGRLRMKLTVRGKVYRPIMILMGLPVKPCWWVDWVEQDGGVRFFPVTADNPHNAEGYIDDLERRLDHDEFRAMVWNEPMVPKGAILRNWKARPWPDGNLLQGWAPDPEREVSIGVDFGRKPAIVFIQHDPTLGPNGLDVIFHEICLNDVDMDEWVPLILKVVHPKSDPWSHPEGRLTLAAGAGDKAGANRDTHGRSDIDDLARKPGKGGIGLRLHRTTDPVKVDVPTGLKKLHRLIYDTRTGERRLVMTQELWDKGQRAPEEAMNLPRAIERYIWRSDGSGIPKKDGKNDHLIDALRYWVIWFRWFDSPLDDRVIKQSVTQPKKKTTKRRTRPRSGQGRPRGF
jgi:hypothetical protein